ncbi:MAG: hypothetical protein ACLFUG_02085 [Nitriliruptoraceae bacterium]
MTAGVFPACAACGAPDARQWLDATPRCDRCYNAVLSERHGWPALPDPPPDEAVPAADGRPIRLRYRLTWAPSGAVCAEVEEANQPIGEGFRFQVIGQHDADPRLVLARLRRLAQHEVGRAYLEPDEAVEGGGGRGWALAGSEVAGRIAGTGDGAVPEPTLVVDGRELTWTELGGLLASFEGWMFRLLLSDSCDDLDVGAAADRGAGEGAAGEVVPLFGAAGTSGPEASAPPSIDEALAGFLAEQEARLAASTYARYEDIVDLLRICLNSYGHTTLSGRDAQTWQEAFDAGDEDAFTRLFGPERIIEGYGEFLGYFMVRKVAASKQQLKDAGTVTRRLARWLAEQGYVDAEVAEVARGRAAEAGRELPRADELGEQLFLQAQRTRLPVPPDDIPDEDWVEDLLPITRVEDGRLWFDSLGPVEVPVVASDAAQVGWEVSVVLARLDGVWRLVEVGGVYP